jgi:hypothetical protein
VPKSGVYVLRAGKTSQRGTHQPHILKSYLNLEKLLWTNSKSKELVNPEILEPTYSTLKKFSVEYFFS